MDVSLVRPPPTRYSTCTLVTNGPRPRDDKHDCAVVHSRTGQRTDRPGVSGGPSVVCALAQGRLTSIVGLLKYPRPPVQLSKSYERCTRLQSASNVAWYPALNHHSHCTIPTF